ncbi:AtpZ/AtpI family protein [bacterium]|nr:AtpZ/AtpI family protein [bacterium]
MRPNKPRSSDSAFKYVGMAGKIAFGLMGPIIAACFIGIYLDKRFNTTPWMTIVLLLLGLVVGFGGLYSMFKND